MKTRQRVLMYTLSMAFSMASVALPVSKNDSNLSTDVNRTLKSIQSIDGESVNTRTTPCRQVSLCKAKQFGVDGVTPLHAIEQDGAVPGSRRHDKNEIAMYGTETNLENGSAAGFTREVDAVIAAMNQYNPLSIDEDREYMGVILKKADHYFYTVKKGHRHRRRITIRLRIPEGYGFTALWHTHGAAGIGTDTFSDADTKLVKSLNKALYLGDYTGELKMFTPTDKILRGFSVGTEPGTFGKGKLLHDEIGNVIQIATGTQ